MIPGIVAAQQMIAAPGGGGSFTPLDLTGLNRWYDPSDAATVTLDGSSKVSALADKSGNGFDLSQASSGERPALRVEASRNALDFTPIQWLVSLAGMAAFSGTDLPFAFFAIVRSDAAAPSHEHRFAGITRSTTNQPLHLFGETSTAVGWVHIHRDDGGTIKTVATGVVADTSLHLITYLFSGTQTTIRLDGVAQVTNGDSDVGAMTVDQFVLGAFHGASTFTSFNGAVGECFLLTAIPGATDLANAESYLAGRWGITLP